jgi:UDP-sulfoquinovose synthase
MKILILGGDGYLGWPTAMHFSSRGHEVTVVDNYLRRKASEDVGVKFLYDNPNLIERAKIWEKVSGFKINVVIGDLVDPSLIRSLFDGSIDYNWPMKSKCSGSPDTVIHYAEQPSAPYSMIDYNRANETLHNNIIVTNNLMFAARDYSPETHIIKLGTMGEYGTPKIDIEEGWIDISHKGKTDTILFPRQASSVYHTSKIMDTDLLWFGTRMWKLRVTDLMQGPVYGIHTEESQLDDNLKTHFNYDEVFGTVINRFLIQSLIGHPLTVYGKGGQTRGYLNIKDTLQCIEIAQKNPPERGKMDIFNQIVETFTVNELAERVKEAADEMGYDVTIKNIENPRIEAEDHYYNPTYQGLIDLGVKPHFLSKEILQEMIQILEKYKDNIDESIITQGITW